MIYEEAKRLTEEDLFMKFFHLSDLHIGLKLMNHDMREDQEYILSEVIEVAGREKPDAIVIAGIFTIKQFRRQRQWRFLTIFWKN